LQRVHSNEKFHSQINTIIQKMTEETELRCRCISLKYPSDKANNWVKCI